MNELLLQSHVLRPRDVAIAKVLLDFLPHPALWIASDHTVHWANRAARAAYGVGPATTCHQMTHGRDTPCDANGEECPLRSASQQRALTTTHLHVGPTGESNLVQVVAMPVEGGGMLELHVDLGGGVTLDPVTGLYRREFWAEIAERERDLLVRLREPYGVIFLDIDRFKRFNDSWGHAVGDQALVELATAVRTAIRGSDTAGRFGGDELVVFLPHTDPAGLLLVAERIAALARARPVHTPEGDRHFTVSVGARWARWDEPLADAVNAADRAMYEAKAQGRDRVVVSSEAPSALAATH